VEIGTELYDDAITTFVQKNPSQIKYNQTCGTDAKHSKLSANAEGQKPLKDLSFIQQ